MGKLKFLLPVVVFLVIAGAMGYSLFNLDPKSIPSALIDKPAPEFDLDEVPGEAREGKGLATANLREGRVTLVNVFASWCVSCRVEHPVFMDLAKTGVVDIYGLNYKDRPEDAAGWLDRFGDPYARTGMDREGRVGFNFGVYGVPETFIIGPDGHIAEKIIGPVTPRILQEKILPLVERLSK